MNHLDLIKLQRKMSIPVASQTTGDTSSGFGLHAGLVWTRGIVSSEILLADIPPSWLKRAFAWVPAFHILCVHMRSMLRPGKQPGDQAEDPVITGCLSL